MQPSHRSGPDRRLPSAPDWVSGHRSRVSGLGYETVALSAPRFENQQRIPRAWPSLVEAHALGDERAVREPLVDLGPRAAAGRSGAAVLERCVHELLERCDVRRHGAARVDADLGDVGPEAAHGPHHLAASVAAEAEVVATRVDVVLEGLERHRAGARACRNRLRASVELGLRRGLQAALATGGERHDRHGNAGNRPSRSHALNPSLASRTGRTEASCSS